jgi:hypothetical protein
MPGLQSMVLAGAGGAKGKLNIEGRGGEHDVMKGMRMECREIVLRSASARLGIIRALHVKLVAECEAFRRNQLGL